VATTGFAGAYGVDVVLFLAAFYAVIRLPSLPPGEGARRAGLASVVEGLKFLGTRKVVLMTFVLDIIAMVFSSPRALFPAIAAGVYHISPGAAGLLYTAPAVGAVLATLLGGMISRYHRHGWGVVLAIAAWAVAIAGFGLVSAMWLGLLFLAAAGAADTVSAVYRQTILQTATTDRNARSPVRGEHGRRHRRTAARGSAFGRNGRGVEPTSVGRVRWLAVSRRCRGRRDLCAELSQVRRAHRSGRVHRTVTNSGEFEDFV